MSPASSEERPSDEADDSRRRLLLVSLGDEVVGLRAETVVEVITARPFARIPGTAECVAGLVNRRGRILTVLDLGLAAGSSPAATAPDHRIVVVSFRSREVGLAVRDVLLIADESASVSGPGDPKEATAPRATGTPEQPRVVELETLLTPFFADEAPGEEEPTFETT